MNWHKVNFHDTLWHAPSRSVGGKFAQCSRTVYASGTKVMRATNFELFKSLSTTWHAPPHTSRTVHAPFRRLYATLRSVPLRGQNACKCQCSLRHTRQISTFAACMFYDPQTLELCSKMTHTHQSNYKNETIGETKGRDLGYVPPLIENTGLVICPNLHRNSEC